MSFFVTVFTERKLWYIQDSVKDKLNNTRPVYRRLVMDFYLHFPALGGRLFNPAIHAFIIAVFENPCSLSGPKPELTNGMNNTASRRRGLFLHLYSSRYSSCFGTGSVRMIFTPYCSRSFRASVSSSSIGSPKNKAHPWAEL